MELHTQQFMQGGKAFIAMPVAEFQQLMESYSDLQDVRSVREAKAAIAEGAETFPAKLVFALARAKTSGKKLKLWREYRGLSKAALAELIGVNGQYISMIESEKRKGTAAIYKKSAKIFECSLDDLL